jgi:hypothetical protein
MRIWIEEAARSRHGSEAHNTTSLNLGSGGSGRDGGLSLGSSNKKGVARQLRSGIERGPSSCMAEPFEWLLELLINAIKELWRNF